MSTLGFKEVWLGTEDRIHICPYVVSQMVGPDAERRTKGIIHYTPFQNKEEWMEYGQLVSIIKRTIQDFNDQHFQHRTIDHATLINGLNDVWIPKIETLIRRWGKEMVPSDIRFSYNDVLVEALDRPKVK